MYIDAFYYKKEVQADLRVLLEGFANEETPVEVQYLTPEGEKKKTGLIKSVSATWVSLEVYTAQEIPVSFKQFVLSTFYGKEDVDQIVLKTKTVIIPTYSIFNTASGDLPEWEAMATLLDEKRKRLNREFEKPEEEGIVSSSPQEV